VELLSSVERRAAEERQRIQVLGSVGHRRAVSAARKILVGTVVMELPTFLVEEAREVVARLDQMEWELLEAILLARQVALLVVVEEATAVVL